MNINASSFLLSEMCTKNLKIRSFFMCVSVCVLCECGARLRVLRIALQFIDTCRLSLIVLFSHVTIVLFYETNYINLRIGLVV